MPLGFLIRSFFHLKIFLLQRKILSPVEITTKLSLPWTQIHTHARTHTLSRDRFLLPNTVTAHYHNIISARIWFSVSLWLGNQFLFSTIFLGGKQKEGTGQQLGTLKGRDGNTKALFSPADFFKTQPTPQQASPPTSIYSSFCCQEF